MRRQIRPALQRASSGALLSRSNMNQWCSAAGPVSANAQTRTSSRCNVVPTLIKSPDKDWGTQHRVCRAVGAWVE